MSQSEDQVGNLLEKNVPKFSCFFVKNKGESLCFIIDCPKMENLSDMLKIQLASRVTVPEDWTLARLERFMMADFTQNPNLLDEHFRTDEN